MKDINFEVRLCWHSGRKYFVGWHNVKVFGIAPQRLDEVIASVPLW